MPNTFRDALARSRHVRELAESLKRMFRQQAMDVASRVTLDGGVPELTGWVEPIAMAAMPMLLRMTQNGIAETQLRLARRGARPGTMQSDGLRRYAVPTREAFGETAKGVMSHETRGSSSRLYLPGLSSHSYRQVTKAAPSDVRVSFDLFNPRVIDAVDAAAFAFCRETMETARSDLATTLAKLRRALRGGLQRGDAIRKLAEDVHRIFADPYRAYRIATTECLTGDTLIRGANVTAVYRRQYVGPIVEIIVEGGEKLAGTPNHPVLTHRGWVGLGDIQETDYVVCDANGIDHSRFVTTDIDEKQPPVTLNEILDLGPTVWANSRQRTAHPDFHGDGMDSYVDVFDSNRLLRFGVVASRQQLVENGFLAPSNQVSCRAVGQSDTFPLLRGVHNTECFGYGSDSDAGFVEESLDYPSSESVVVLHADHAIASGVSSNDFVLDCLLNWSDGFGVPLEPVLLGLRVRPLNTGRLGYTEDDARIAAERSSDFGGTQTAHVKFKRLLSLRVIENWNGHVFNLETDEGFYNANGYYTKNSSRAQHAGQLMAARESGVVRKKSWVASADACDLCLSIMEKGPIELHLPFWVDSKGGPYATVNHPPAHPFCFCSQNEEIE